MHSSHQRVLLRVHQSPFDTYSAVQTLARDAIGGNVGNLLFSHAAYRLLDTRAAEVAPDRLLRSDPGWVNEHFDVVVLPGSSNAFGKFYASRAGIADPPDRAAADSRGGAGVNAQLRIGAAEPIGGIGDPVRRFMRAVLRDAPSVGVRGERTARYLGRLGFAEDELVVIGCPSMFANGPELTPLRHVERLAEDAPISLNFSPYVKGIGTLIADQAAKYPNLVYTAQDIGTLNLLLTGRYRSVLPVSKGAPSDLLHPLINADRTVLPLNVPSVAAPPGEVRVLLRHAHSWQYRGPERGHPGVRARPRLPHDRTRRVPPDPLPGRRPSGLAGRRRASPERRFGAMAKAHPERWRRLADFLADHHLAHIYLDGVEAGDFDARIAAATYPEVVRLDPGHGARVAAARVANLGRRVTRRMQELPGPVRRVLTTPVTAR